MILGSVCRSEPASRLTPALLSFTCSSQTFYTTIKVMADTCRWVWSTWEELRDGKHTLYPLSVSLQEPEGAGSDHQVDSAHLGWLPAPLFPARSLNHWIVFQSLTHHRLCWLQCSHSLPRVLTVILLLSLLKNKPLTVTSRVVVNSCADAAFTQFVFPHQIILI